MIARRECNVQHVHAAPWTLAEVSATLNLKLIPGDLKTQAGNVTVTGVNWGLLSKLRCPLACGCR